MSLYFCMVLKDNTDASDSLMWGMNDKFVVKTELVCMEPMKSTTGKDLYERLSRTFEWYKLLRKRLTSVATDGSLNLTG
jgi:hypothetical protein